MERSVLFFWPHGNPPSFSLVPHPILVFRLTQRKFQSLKKNLSAHSLSGIFFPLLLPEAVLIDFVGEQVSRRGQEVSRLVLGSSPEITFASPFQGTR